MIAKIGKVERVFDNKLLSRAVEDFCEIDAQIRNLKERLDDFKLEIVLAAQTILEGDEAATISFIEGENKVKVAFGWKIEVKDVDNLARILGDSFDALVTTEIVYKPERKLKELALNNDMLKECLEIKEKSPSVTVVQNA